MMVLLGSVLATSLLGSPHCAGMCGGFVAFYSGTGPARSWPAHAAYNAGRLVSYALLGALAGGFGVGLDRAGAMAGVVRAAGLVAGALMVVWGLASLLASLGGRGAAGHLPPAWLGAIRGALIRARDWPPAFRAATLGIVTTLLPCGFLWAYVAIATGTASPLAGALVMAVFWAGTVPVMGGLGALAGSALAPLRRRVPALSGLALVALGLLTLAGKTAPHVHGTGAHTAHAAHGAVVGAR